MMRTQDTDLVRSNFKPYKYIYMQAHARNESPAHNAASLQLPSGQLGLNDCTCPTIHKFELEVTSNLKISTLNLKLRSSDCNKSMRWIKAVAVQLNNSPHWQPSTLAMRGQRKWSTWKLAPPTRAIPLPRRCHDIGEHIMKSVISHCCDIRNYWYQRAISWIICSDFMCHIIRYWYQRRFCMICIWYRIWYGMKIAQEMGKWLWY